MKKIITRPDGSKEEIEGTAQELSEYEKKLKESQIHEEKKRPGLLTDVKQLEDYKKLVGEYHIPSYRYGSVHSPTCEIMLATGGWLSVVPPRCTCGAEPVYTKPYITTTSSDSSSYGDIKFYYDEVKVNSTKN